jgi:ribosome-associated toxin RatA of RatAB toxin-antitoxin module
MSDNSFNFSITHLIPAPKKRVYQVLADMEAYPEFINGLISVKREGELYHFVARVMLLRVSATLAVNEVPGEAINFRLVEGPVEQLTGQWRVEAAETAGQTKVTLTVQAASGGRGQWLLRLTTKFIETQSDHLIALFSNRIMALEAGKGQFDNEQGKETP